VKRIREQLARGRDEEGFTLIELLIVVIILGILAAVVIFAVSGITDRGQTSACKTDTRTLRTAEEANFAKNSTYALPPNAQDTLKTNGFLGNKSTLHDIAAGTGGDPYNVIIIDAKCGTLNAKVGTSATDY
jgi:prepilin-type N-terminal cleavage/methylation domain-containing protein